MAVHAVVVQSQLQDSREQIVLSREEERRRLRNDLHDDLGPTLAATALQLEATSDLVASDPDRAVVGLQRAATSLRDSVGAVRRIVDDLRPTTLDELGLVGATREQADGLPARGCRLGWRPAATSPRCLRRSRWRHTGSSGKQ